MTLLRDLKINKSYTSKENDIVKEFLNPTLSISSLYYRVSAYYSSYSLQGIAEGLSAMITNNAKIKMIISFFINEQDYNAFIDGKEKTQVYIEENFINDKEELKRLMIEDSVRAFSFLVATDRLQIKFVMSAQGIFHEKYGIIFDSNNDFVGFSGSMNETLNGLTINFEKIKVFKSWKEEEREYINPDLLEFERYWGGNVDGCIIQDMPDKNRNVILESFKEFEIEMNALKYSKKEKPPWPHQLEALQKWKGNNYKGILEMATGTGKTRAAIMCINDFKKLHGKSLILIAVPTDVLISQWEKELRKKENGINPYIKKISGDSAVSIDDLYQTVSSREISINDGLIILGTYKMLSSMKFSDLIPSSFDGEILLVADEVHHIAAENYSKVMDDRYHYRLGLSATPERYFDEGGSQDILEYFERVVYTFDLKEAISNNILTPYDYYLHFTYLNDKEAYEYGKLTKKLFNRLNYRNKDDVDENKNVFKNLENIIEIKRARILKKASGKKEILKSILNDMKRKNQLKHLLIYFEDNEQIADYQDVFNELSIFSVKVDSGKSEQDRDAIIDKFSKGDIDCLLAMKILDEGVDVPSVERAILVSSSGNPAQFIQRRGRLLRRFAGKTKAEIHDILISVKDQYGLGLSGVEKSILYKELRRAKLFCETAKNSRECMNVISNISLKYNLGVISS
ncbi:MAG: DEAD/DEAH box helicase family protein [Candidatus Thermoplasmatota archaeon]|nr:DEAD/DEAH box helicase family protein [Candidatus Thermoplasmatota archaeon]